MNAAETIEAMRAEVEDIKAKLHDLDPHKAGDLPERVAKMDAAITSAEQWHDLA